MSLTGINYYKYCNTSGPGSSVGIATELRARPSGIESQWGRDFPPVQTGPGAHPTYCKMGPVSFPGVKCGRGVLLTTHPLLVPRSWKSRAIPLPTICATPDLLRYHFYCNTKKLPTSTHDISWFRMTRKVIGDYIMYIFIWLMLIVDASCVLCAMR